MKRLYTFIAATALLLGMQPAHAQKLTYGSVECLRGETSVAIDIDFTQGIYDDEEFDIEGLINDVGDDWEKDSKEVLQEFREAANDKLAKIGIRLLTKQSDKTTYKFLITPLQVDGDGECDLLIQLFRIGDPEILAEIKVNADGGTFGSFMNLFGDGMEEAGEKFGRFLFKALR